MTETENNMKEKGDLVTIHVGAVLAMTPPAAAR